MNDPHPILHNPALAMPDRIAQAFDWLARPEACPAPDQGPAAAKVFLLYRAVDGLLTPEQEADALAARPPIVHEMHRRIRWEISTKAALAYLALAHQNWADAAAKAETALLAWQRAGLKWWPPQVINYLRMSCIAAYYKHLMGEDAGALVNDSILGWQHFAGNVEWDKWPYIWIEETLGHAMALRLLAFIGKAAGIVKFNDFGRDYCGSLAGEGGQQHEHIFYPLLRSMGQINPERAIWKLP